MEDTQAYYAYSSPVPSTAWVCSRLIVALAGSDLAEVIDVRLCVCCKLCCVGSDLCNGLVTV